MTTHPEIAILQRKVMGTFETQRLYLANKPTQFLQDLLHRADDERFNEAFSVRTAAEINRAACVLILEERGQR